jgi:sec-independent protein translocase protein TatC
MWQGILNKVFKAREKIAMNLNPQDEEKPFLDHLEDLRTMLVRVAMTLLGSVLLTFGFNKPLTDIVQVPYKWAIDSAKVTILENAKAASLPEPKVEFRQPSTRTPQEGFMASVNVSLIASVILSFPLLLFFVLQFILPGLKDTEKKVLFPALAVGFGLFLTGVTFSYFMVLPRALDFFLVWNFDHGFENSWMLGDYITFATRFILIFGVSFELPVVVMALVKLDFLSYKLMKTTRKHAIIAIAIFSAVITPTQDVLTLLLLAGPLYVLYEICIWLAYMIEKKDREAFPEYYAQIDKDEQELEKEPAKDDWDNENYNPWFSENDETEKDLEDEYQSQPRPSAPPPEIEKASKTVAISDIVEEPESAEDQGSVMPEEEELPPSADPSPIMEKTTEELAREDERRSGNPPPPSA